MKVLEITNSQLTNAFKQKSRLSFLNKKKSTLNTVTSLEEDLKQAIKEVQQHKKRIIELKTAEELLNEL